MTADDLELWGGLECTVARIGDRYRDEIAETGHRDRLDDLDLVAGLGIRTLRYPVLLETVSPDDPDRCDWTWHDRHLGRIRDLGMRPVVGLIHHGSGPRYTDLLDPAFPDVVARHAGRVARRYPWVELYTPINEPVTTARFSGLYGHWYPHRRDEAAFLRALVNQCRAVALSMRAIRKVNPGARLVQTDDLGRTFSTAALAYQAEYDNGRRWLTFDLLFGQLDRHHPWWRILRDHGIAERELSCFLDGEAAPDIVGINHYLTSDRFLDKRLPRYPEHLRGGNGQERYADVEAVRVPMPAQQIGPAARLREAWARYRAPLAVTEVHHGCTRDEQLRWLAEVWDAARTVRREGADIRAVTVWSMFGSVDWSTLLTRENGVYEPGVFDARATPPRPTALADASRSLAVNGAFDHPVLDTPGWWHREARFYQPRAGAKPAGRVGAAPRSILAVGPQGALLDALMRIATIRGLATTHRPGHGAPDPAGRDGPLGSAWAVVSVFRPGRMTPAEEALLRDCADRGIPWLAFSTDRVFDGRLGRPYLESDATSARDAAGQDAAVREAKLRSIHPKALICRTGPIFGPWAHDGPVWRMIDDLRAGHPVSIDAGAGSPGYLPDVLHVALDLLIDEASGLWHLANPGAGIASQLALRLCDLAGLPPPELAPPPGEEAPCERILGTARGSLLPPLESALERFVGDCGIDWRASGVQIAAE